MRVTYAHLDQQALALQLLQEGLKDFFFKLLLALRGDVDQTREILEDMAQQTGQFGPDDIDELFRELENDGVIEGRPGQSELTDAGNRALREFFLHSLYEDLDPSERGQHRTPYEGGPGEATGETRPYVFGDDRDTIDFNRSIFNTLRRGAEAQMLEDDLEVQEREYQTAVATVLMIDVSHSMILYGEDRMTPAKEAAIILTELIRTKYPKDSIEIVTFGDDAKVIQPDALPKLDAGPYHTNTKAGLELACDLLRRRRTQNKQIVMITDGKPSCVRIGAKLYKNPFGIDPRVATMTMNAAAECRRRGITVSTFMIAQDPYLVNFVEEMTEMCRGRACFVTADQLGKSIFLDFVKHRRRRQR